MEDCTYKAYLEECQENELIESAPINQGRLIFCHFFDFIKIL